MPPPCLSHFHRPRILLKAAQHFIKYYSHDRDLKRRLGFDYAIKSKKNLNRLIDFEAQLEQERTSRSTNYNLQLHIRVLAVLIHQMITSQNVSESG